MCCFLSIMHLVIFWHKWLHNVHHLPDFGAFMLRCYDTKCYNNNTAFVKFWFVYSLSRFCHILWHFSVFLCSKVSFQVFKMFVLLLNAFIVFVHYLVKYQSCYVCFFSVLCIYYYCVTTDYIMFITYPISVLVCWGAMTRGAIIIILPL